MTIEVKSVGIKLKALRNGFGFTQNNVAQYLKVDQSFIEKYETGTISLSSDTLDKLVALFCCPITSILSHAKCGEFPKFLLPIENLNGEDLAALAAINKIALNQAEMDEII